MQSGSRVLHNTIVLTRTLQLQANSPTKLLSFGSHLLKSFGCDRGHRHLNALGTERVFRCSYSGSCQQVRKMSGFDPLHCMT
eukprot:2491818-Amphidinium_carterae.1